MSGISQNIATPATPDGVESGPSHPEVSSSISTDQRETDMDVDDQPLMEAVGEETEATTIEADDPDARLAAHISAQEIAGYDSENDQDAPPPQAERLECLCGDQLTEEVEYIWLTCGHARCVGCVNTMVKVGLESRASFPPRCCPKTLGINLEEIVPFLNDEQVLRWFAVAEEYADDKPMYCDEKVCSKYLSRATVTDDGRWRLCEDCGGSTCTSCGALSSAHENLADCPERLAKIDRDFMEGKGWKPCANCNHMIERIDGCDHMTCENCHHEFCYGCGRSYVGGLPCNCHGQNPWVEGDDDANDMLVQQQAFDNFAVVFGPGHQLGGAAIEHADAAENQENIGTADDMQDTMDEDAEENTPIPNPRTDQDFIASNLPNFGEELVRPAPPAIDVSVDGVAGADQQRLPGLRYVLGEQYDAFFATRAHWADRFDRHGT